MGNNNQQKKWYDDGLTEFEDFVKDEVKAQAVKQIGIVAKKAVKSAAKSIFDII